MVGPIRTVRGLQVVARVNNGLIHGGTVRANQFDAIP